MADNELLNEFKLFLSEKGKLREKRKPGQKKQPVDYSNERDLKLLEKGRLKRIGPWKKDVAPPSVGTPWPVEFKESDVREAIRKGRPDWGLGAEWLAWTSGSRPTKGYETSLKKMGLEGQPKPEIAPKKKSKITYFSTPPKRQIQDRLEEAVRAGLKEVTKDFVKKKSRKK